MRVRAPRLRESDHRITLFLIMLSGSPWTLLLLGIAYVSLWNHPWIDRLVGLGGLLVGMIDILSNAYQEVSADDRQAEVLARMERIELSLELITRNRKEPS